MNYREHQAMQAARNASNGGSGDRPKVHFVNEFLSKDGDVAVVRFPYHSMNDIVYTPTHNVAWPGAKYGKRVVCNEQGPCPLCDEGIKVDTRVFVKFLTYTAPVGSQVVLNNTVWDRPSAFADIDLKNLFDEYGDISKLLFKIRRSGAGKDTRYTIQPVINTAVYPEDVYAADFHELDQIDPLFIMTKSQAQYNALLHPEQSATEASPAAAVRPVDTYTASAPSAVPTAAPMANSYVPHTDTAPWETPTQAAPVAPAPAPSAPTEQPRRQVKYTF